MAEAADQLQFQEDHELHDLDELWIVIDVIIYLILDEEGNEYLLFVPVESFDHPDRPTVAPESLTKVVIGPDDTSSASCAICLEEFEVGSEVRAMDCSHKFHEECILEWLRRKKTCPLCRFEMPTV